MPRNSIVLDLQREAMKADTPVTSLLRTAKVIAAKLGLDDALLWINQELEGYKKTLIKDLPDYRRLRGTPKAWDIFQGWVTINSKSEKVLDWFSSVPLGGAIGSIEHSLQSVKDGGILTFQYPPRCALKFRRQSEKSPR